MESKNQDRAKHGQDPNRQKLEQFLVPLGIRVPQYDAAREAIH